MKTEKAVKSLKDLKAAMSEMTVKADEIVKPETTVKTEEDREEGCQK